MRGERFLERISNYCSLSGDIDKSHPLSTIIVGIKTKTKNNILDKISLINPKTAAAGDIGDIRTLPFLFQDEDLNEDALRKYRKILYGQEEAEIPVGPLAISQDLVSHYYHYYPYGTIFPILGDNVYKIPFIKTWYEHRKQQEKKGAIIDFTSKNHNGQMVCDIFYIQELAKQGPSAVSEKVKKYLQKQGIEEFYVSFDMETINGSSGLQPHEPMVIIRELLEDFTLTGADLTEISPATDEIIVLETSIVAFLLGSLLNGHH